MRSTFPQRLRGTLACRTKVLMPLWLLLFILASKLCAQDAIQSIDAAIARAVAAWEIPGMAVAIVKDDQVALGKGYGVRDSKQGGAVDEHTLFAIASNTKAFNAAGLAILVDEGRLSWDDRVQQYLPDFQLYDAYVSYDMRIRDLLCHRSGLGTFSGDLLWYGTNYSPAEVVRRARYLPQAGVFRGSYGYSNIMFVAAGEIARVVSGKAWPEFIRNRILQPLGMNETILSVRELANRTNVATPHRLREGAWQPVDWSIWDNTVAAGGIISSVSDMAKWLRLQLNRGMLDGKRLFSEDASQTMWTPHTPIPLSRSTRELHPSTHFMVYGLGWVLMDYRGRLVAMHGGGYDGMFSRVALVPEEKLGMVLLTNAMTGIQTALMYQILDMYLGGEQKDWSEIYLTREKAQRQRTAALRKKAIGEQIPGTKPSLPLDAYTGTYGGDLYGDATVRLENGHLVVQFQPAPDLIGDLEHWHFDTFLIRWRKDFAWFGEGTVQFLLDKYGQAIEMKIDVPNDDFWFTELEFKKR